MATRPNAATSSSNRTARMADGARSAAPDADKPASKRWLLITLVVVALAALGVAGYVVLNAPGVRPAAAAPAPVPPKPIFLTVEPMTVNLQSEGRARFLHVGMALKVADEATRARVTQYMPELRSRILLLLSNRQPEALLASEDKARLAEEIRTELNRPLAANLPPLGITSVSFNTFVVQ